MKNNIISRRSFIKAVAVGCTTAMLVSCGKKDETAYNTEIEKNINPVIVPDAPMIAPRQEWYKSNRYELSECSEIIITDGYVTKGYREVWNADDKNSGSIKCYIVKDNNNIKLIITGNGSGGFYANPDSDEMFAETRGANRITGLQYIDTSSVETAKRMFYKSGSEADEWMIDGYQNWNTRRIKNMDDMFKNTGADMINYMVNLSGWDTSSLETATSMFERAGYNAEVFQINVSGWITQKLKRIDYMFANCGYNAHDWMLLGINAWKLGKDDSEYSGDLYEDFLQINASNMFNGAGRNAETFNLDISNFANGKKIVNCDMMFANTGVNSEIWNIDGIETIDMQYVTSINAMFQGAAKSAKEIKLNLNNWNFESLDSCTDTFNGFGENSDNFVINIEKISFKDVINMNGMFEDAGRGAKEWYVTIPTQSDFLNNDSYALYGVNEMVYAEPCYGHEFLIG